MQGKNCTVRAVQCVQCHQNVTVTVDPEDVERHRKGVLAQEAFADSRGVPYLSASERELFISGICPKCWDEIFGDPADQ